MCGGVVGESGQPSFSHRAGPVALPIEALEIPDQGVGVDLAASLGLAALREQPMQPSGALILPSPFDLPTLQRPCVEVAAKRREVILRPDREPRHRVRLALRKVARFPIRDEQGGDALLRRGRGR